MGPALRHGRVLRLSRTVDATDPAGSARPGGWTWGAGRRRGCQLRVAGVRCQVGNADAPGPPNGRPVGGGAAAAWRRVRGGQREGARYRPLGGSAARTVVVRRGVRRADGAGWR